MRASLAASSLAGIVIAACVGSVAFAEPPRGSSEQKRAEVATASLGTLLLAPTTADCGTVASDSVVSLGPAGIQQYSPAKFGHPPTCTAFVTDFKVDSSVIATSSYNSPNLVLDGWDSVREVQLNASLGKYLYASSNVTEAQCKIYDHEITVFRKGPRDRAFVVLGGGKLEPTWNQAGLGWGPVCMLKPGPTFKMIPVIVPPEAAGVVDTYRVALQISGAPGQILTAALHPTR